MHYWVQSIIIAFSSATKKMENPEETAEKVGITALIIQVNWNYMLL